MIPSFRNALRLSAAAALALLLAACGGSDTPAAPPLFSKVYAFGSSVSDTGNACNLSPASCTPNPPYASPRYSNGPVFAELVAARYGASLTPSRLGGTNFAYGGARTGPIAGTTQSVPNMVTQVEQYLASVNYQANPQYLYIIESITFGNDITDALSLAGTNPSAPSTITAGAVANIFGIALRLYSAGARHIVLTNSTDVGKSPLAQAGGAAAVAGATQMSLLFNGGLAQQLPALRAAAPGLNLYYVDAGKFTADVQANPAAFGYTNITQACFNTLLPTPTLCSTPATYFYWDPYHPTAATSNKFYQFAVPVLPQ